MPAEPPGGSGEGGAEDLGRGLFGWLETSSEVARATSDRAWVAAMLAFEVELARAESDLGLMPKTAAEEIASGLAAVRLEASELGRGAVPSGNPVPPLLALLRSRLTPAAGAWLHFGATSQDVIDTALMLVAKRASELIVSDLGRASRALAELARAQRVTPAVGRTLLQPAVPTSFGLRAAGWLVQTLEVRAELGRVGRERLALQLGGAAGNLGALRSRGPELAAIMARRLGLREPTLPWHTDRTRPAELASALAMVTGAAAKVGRDAVLLAQTEVAEAVSPDSGGRSSTMPQKRNPSRAAGLIAGHRRAVPLAAAVLGGMAQELERSAGEWQAEWLTMTQLMRLSGGSARGLAELAEGLGPDPERMRANLELTRGAVMAEQVALGLGERLGRERAQELLEAALRRSAERGTELEHELELGLEGALPPGELAALLDPAAYLEAAGGLVDRALAVWASQEATAP